MPVTIDIHSKKINKNKEYDSQWLLFPSFLQNIFVVNRKKAGLEQVKGEQPK